MNWLESMPMMAILSGASSRSLEKPISAMTTMLPPDWRIQVMTETKD
ncbi:hypothetical protein ACLHZ0_00640 [Aeromonas salmonicida]|nr:hypothetical protein [Aeromonas salmonicida]